MATARSEAIKRNTNAVLCPSANPTATTPTCTGGGGGTWETGWLLFIDAAPSNSTFAAADGDTLIRVHEPLPGNNTLRSNNAQLSNAITFAPSGMTTLTPPAAADPPHHLKLCDSRGVGSARAITLETTGRARILRQSTLATLACP
jgi:type IV fimbrial biogenesis protein FimT